jgi:hypothetical protein
MIKVTTKSNNQVVITLEVFKKIIRLPPGNKILNLVDAKTFLELSSMQLHCIERLFSLPANMLSKLSTFDISLLHNHTETFHGCLRVWFGESRLHKYPGLSSICIVPFLSKGCHIL